MSSRLRPLHTCGVSFLIIAHITCSRVQNLDGRLGSTARKMVRLTKFLNPFIFVMQYLWLLFLSFIDDRLLAIANIMEKTFPPSKLVFDKIDDLLHLIETFPGKFDDAVQKLPCINQVVFLEWAVTHAISMLKSMISILMNWGRDGTREKEILVDMNYNKDHNGSESADKSKYCSNETISSMSETQAAMNTNIKSDAMKRTYIEVLKMGTKGAEDDEDCKENEKGNDKRPLEDGTRDQKMEGKEEFDNEKGSTKRVKDAESCEKGDENNENPGAEMEKAEGNDQNYERIISNEENSEVKGEWDAMIMKGTYKEVLKMGTQGEEDDDNCKRSMEERTRDQAMEDKEEFENDEDEDGCDCENNESRTDKMEESVEKTQGNEENSEATAAGVMNYEYEEKGSNGSIEKEENILELFETAWLMKPTGKGKENPMPRSASIV